MKDLQAVDLHDAEQERSKNAELRTLNAQRRTSNEERLGEPHENDSKQSIGRWTFHAFYTITPSKV